MAADRFDNDPAVVRLGLLKIGSGNCLARFH
jgi:hypothetical protein